MEHIPSPSSRNVTLRIDRSGERALRKQHPWLFEEGIQEQSHEGSTGDLAVIFDRSRKFLAIGLYDPCSSIRVRILHSGKPTAIGPEFFARRLAEITGRRTGLISPGTTGYRLVNGENEGMPGLVVDRYADTLVLKLYTPAWLPHLRDLLPGLTAAAPFERLVLRLSRECQRRKDELFGLQDGSILVGPPLEGSLTFQENGLWFECDPRLGQKTGFFLDQRDNRARVERLARDRTVLNVFAYTGGFSLYAARGGARQVVSLDHSRPALEAAERNFARNRSEGTVPDVRHQVIAADAFAALDNMALEKQRFDLVVIDPPSFASRQSQVRRALSSYRRLTRLGLAVLRPEGRLVMASCSARVSSADFFGLIHRTAREAGRPLDEHERTEHPGDHPVGFPQGAYLKCLFATAPTVFGNDPCRGPSS
jgi:23S rRNA (cytosine1962-C5)-methyltransferase